MKEDKYESAIRNLTDKLKEVRTLVPITARLELVWSCCSPLTAGHMTPVLPSVHWLREVSLCCWLGPASASEGKPQLGCSLTLLTAFQAENRAEAAERTLSSCERTISDLEGGSSRATPAPLLFSFFIHLLFFFQRLSVRPKRRMPRSTPLWNRPCMTSTSSDPVPPPLPLCCLRTSLTPVSFKHSIKL